MEGHHLTCHTLNAVHCTESDRFRNVGKVTQPGQSRAGNASPQGLDASRTTSKSRKPWLWKSDVAGTEGGEAPLSKGQKACFAFFRFLRASLQGNSTGQEATSQNRHASVQKTLHQSPAQPPRCPRRRQSWQPDVDKLATRVSKDSQGSHFPHLYDSIRNPEMCKSWHSYCFVKETKY